MRHHENVVPKVVAIALSLAVQGAALTAPFVHAHLDDHGTAHHAARTVHSHWGGHPHAAHHSDAPAIESGDQDRAVFINAFVAVTASVFSVPALVHGVFALPTPAEMAAHRGVEVVRSHDPPRLGNLPSRAPPAFLS